MPREKVQVPQAVQACHDLLLWVIPLLDQFPRSRRFTLGERIESELITVLQRLVEAAYTRERQSILARANLDLDVVRHLWRLAYELKVIAVRRYDHGAELMESLGRQIGGWRRGPTVIPT